ncbi:methyltransferase, FkbM family [Selenomonas ruminantium]|uniref:Methyltransferase, FkbM family n=1 Tax=Selenomonas ruminantium TaxID=971 RepID=A0A1M6TEI5_SELRU|nr:FkbM family methyltransferase [Selenomonas ruminantium]SHK55373.1 methyltransferase, FkbM family [Selenomonas ruminantium]
MSIKRHLDKFKESRYQKQIIKMYKDAGVRPASDGRSMDIYCDIIKNNTTLQVKNVFELGANYAQDAERIRHNFDLKPMDVYVFEAHPKIADAIKSFYKFNIYNLAIFNESKIIELNLVDTDNDANTGVSTMKKSLVFSFDKTTEVKAVRMDYMMDKLGISHIDFCKIDVEGVNWEALDGFGDRLKDVNAIQIEAEHNNCYEDEKLWPDIVDILERNGFSLMHFERHYNQSDSFWVQDRFIKREV